MSWDFTVLTFRLEAIPKEVLAVDFQMFFLPLKFPILI